MSIATRTTIFASLFLASIFQSKAQDKHRFDPPWNNPPKSAVEFTIPGINNIPDLYGDIENPQLVVFFAGNQFMCVDSLLAGFRRKHPEIQRIFVETLPPGILAKQIEGGSLTLGNLRITAKPDVYTAGKDRINSMAHHFSSTHIYAYNKLTLMVQKGNPKKMTGLKDLNNASLKIAMPNPAWEGIGRQIEKAYRNVGGEALRKAVMKDKVENGSTYLTKIHHRESPMRILYGESDVAPVWTSEVVYQKMIGHPVDEVVIPKDQNIRATYIAGQLKNAPHPEAAKLFIDFLTSDEAKMIYRKYGFETD